MTYRIKIADHMDLFRAAHEAIPFPTATQLPVASQYVKWAWQERYGVDVVYENSRAAYLDFKDERHYILFVLGIDQNGR